MSPSRLRLLALPTAPCKHGALFFSFLFFCLEREFKAFFPLRLHLEKKPVTSVTFDLCYKDSPEIHIEGGFSTFILMYSASFSPCDLFELVSFFALGPRKDTQLCKQRRHPRVFFLFFFHKVRRETWSQEETPVVFIQ